MKITTYDEIEKQFMIIDDILDPPCEWLKLGYHHCVHSGFERAEKDQHARNVILQSYDIVYTIFQDFLNIFLNDSQFSNHLGFSIHTQMPLPVSILLRQDSVPWM
jgi:hypothetical protein